MPFYTELRHTIAVRKSLNVLKLKCVVLQIFSKLFLKFVKVILFLS